MCHSFLWMYNDHGDLEVPVLVLGTLLVIAVAFCFCVCMSLYHRFQKTEEKLEADELEDLEADEQEEAEEATTPMLQTLQV